MIGHGRPTPRLLPVVCRLATIVGLLCALPARAAEIDVRLRFAWGSGPQAPQKWFGAISAPECTLTALQPLGLEADEVAALRLVDGAVRVSPIVPRAFDGCDVTLRGDEAAVVTIALDNPSAPDGKDVQISLGELAAEQLRA
ncbi:MAG TPA: hypothetical protein VEQ85_09020, partial [Lacipirellulaceae bacterium]|nr:hypothetical protein [Lacipirellulaceae bacterium]